MQSVIAYSSVFLIKFLLAFVSLQREKIIQPSMVALCNGAGSCSLYSTHYILDTEKRYKIVDASAGLEVKSRLMSEYIEAEIELASGVLQPNGRCGRRWTLPMEKNPRGSQGVRSGVPKRRWYPVPFELKLGGFLSQVFLASGCEFAPKPDMSYRHNGSVSLIKFYYSFLKNSDDIVSCSQSTSVV